MTRSIAHSLQAACQGAGFRLTVAAMLLSPTMALSADEPDAIRDALSAAENSVLVAKRQLENGPEENAPSGAGLEPISQHSDQAPELADPPSADQPPKPLSSTEEGEAAAADASERAPQRLAMRRRRSSDPADVANVYESSNRFVPARFRGVTPGVTTAEELTAEWGAADQATDTDAGELLGYTVEPFAAVEALVEEGGVTLLRVELDSQQPADRLASRLGLAEFKAVEILDEAGEDVVGLAYPEKGMLLLLAEGAAAPSVTHMVIQPIEAEAFALRADQAPYDAFENKLADLERAVGIDDGNAYANWQLAGLHLLTGAVNKAASAAEVAIQAEPGSDTYRLRWADCLAEQGEYDAAVLEARKVLDSKAAPDVVKAGALYLMGRMASLGESTIADKAIGFHTLAIETADKLATSGDPAERVAAKRLLVDTHLAVAREVSRRKYDRKDEIVGQWIGRASGFAEEIIKSGDGGLELRLAVAREALAALANLKPSKDPAPWIKEAEEAASQLLADSRDPLFRSRVEWQLGQAYFHALRIEHSRKQPEQGLSHASEAIDRLAAGAVAAEARPSAESLVGRLYFHIGALHAVHNQDHKQAVEWYEKAEPMLTAGAPKSEFVVPRRRGEALVSMAVSYWEQGEREHAVELTLDGADLMERAVAAGVLDEAALAVPYGNLSTMHRRLGNRDESTRFADLARDARGGTKLPSFAEAVTRAADEPASRQASNPQRRAPAERPSAGNRQRSEASPPTNRRSNGQQPRRTASRSTGGAQRQQADAAEPTARPSRVANRRRLSGVRRPKGHSFYQ